MKGIEIIFQRLAPIQFFRINCGVQIPIKKEVYEPILIELEENGIIFKEKNVPYLGYNPENVNG